MSTTLSEKSWNSSEDYEDDNSSTTTSSVTRRISGDLDIPGGVITTHCVSSVIKPGSKQNHDPLQFVKIQSTELSRKAVEQIRLAEEVKITKEKIKEVEEEWQNNLLNWKSKRRQSRGNPGNEDSETADQQPRRVKTFSEIIKEKAKSGQRIGYNLDKYIDSPLDDFESDPFDDSDVVVSKKEEKRENVLDTSSVKEPNCDENHENKKPNGVSNVRKEQDISVLQNVCNPDLKNDVHKSDKNFFDNLKNQPSESLAKNNSRDSTTLRNCSRWSQEVASGDEDEEFQENLEQDKDLEEKQALSFKAKLFAFENLAKPTESNNVLPRSSSRKNIDSKHGEMTQKEKIVTTKSRDKDRHTSDPTLNQCGQREQQHHNQHLFMQQQQPQQEQYQMQMNASRSPSEICSMSRDSNYEKKDVEQEVIRITEKNTKAGKNSSRISKALKTHDPQSGNLIPLQFDQKQYYLLDENCSDMSSAIPDDPDPFYHGNDEANSFKRQQLLNNQEHRAATLMHPPLSQQNHYMYHGQLHNDNVSQRSQANPGQDFYKTPKPLAQEKQIPNTLCPSQPLERQQFVYNPHNNGKPLSTVQHPSSYNLNHWLIQEAELRRQLAANNQCAPKPAPRVGKPPPPPPPPEDGINHLYENSPLAPQMFSKPEQKQQKRMLSVSGRKKCSSCGDELGRGCAAMVIESLSLYYHINCFRCSVCHIQLGNGTCGTDVRVRNHKLHCKNCYSNDEAGLKFSRV